MKRERHVGLLFAILTRIRQDTQETGISVPQAPSSSPEFGVEAVGHFPSHRQETCHASRDDGREASDATVAKCGVRADDSACRWRAAT
jgi:hypothetical protein